MTLKEIQQDAILRYNITINTKSTCWGRTHAHIKGRMICKWKPKRSIHSTFTLLHEIGHIETNKFNMRRCEQEFYATQWAVDRFHEYGLEIPDSIRETYQDYIDEELARGLRRGGKNYPESLKVKWGNRYLYKSKYSADESDLDIFKTSKLMIQYEGGGIDMSKVNRIATTSTKVFFETIYLEDYCETSIDNVLLFVTDAETVEAHVREIESISYDYDCEKWIVRFFR